MAGKTKRLLTHKKASVIKSFGIVLTSSAYCHIVVSYILVHNVMPATYIQLTQHFKTNTFIQH